MTTMTNDLLCEKCNDYGWNMVDGVCTVCLDLVSFSLEYFVFKPEQKEVTK